MTTPDSWCTFSEARIADWVVVEGILLVFSLGSQLVNRACDLLVNETLELFYTSVLPIFASASEHPLSFDIAVFAWFAFF